MLPLGQVLIDLDVIHLRAIAQQRAIELDSNIQREIVDQLAPTLLEAESIALALRGLSDEERDALAMLQRAGGKMRAHVFLHQFGPIRRFGPARLEREEPWVKPVSPAESLWYKGFLGRSFVRVEDETPELIFVPDDLLPLLPAPALNTGTEEPPPMDGTPPTPAVIQIGADVILTDLYELLLYIQLHRPRAVEQLHLGADDLSRLNEILRRPELVECLDHAGETERLAFVHRLCRRLGLLELQSGRLRLTQEARNWLDKPAATQLRSLLDAWRSDEEWNDLWHVSDIQCERAGWENDPVRTRERFLTQLGELAAGEWHSITDLVERVKRTDPDFQRPSGDYNSWYIRDVQNDVLLIGFEHWDVIEGGLITYYLRGPLHWLGAIDLGCQAEGDTVAQLFRITGIGQRFLAGDEESAPEMKVTPVMIEPSLTLRLAEGATLYYRLQIERFAERASEGRTFQITPRSLLIARSQNIQPAAILSFLEKSTGMTVPTAMRDELHRLWHSVDSIRLRRLVTLDFSEPALLEWLQGDPESSHLLGEMISPTCVQLPEQQLPRLLARLRLLGLQPEIIEKADK